MGDVGCSPGGMGSTREDRRNGSSSLVKQDTVGDGSGAAWVNQIGLLEISTRLSNLIYRASWLGVALQARDSHLVGTKVH